MLLIQKYILLWATYDPAIPFFEHYMEEENMTQMNMCTLMFIAALYTIAGTRGKEINVHWQKNG